MDKYYTDEKNAQILLSVLKAHGIKKVIASPGSANSPIVAGFQYDNYFEVFSCVDERSAAYLACGLAAESNEPVAISCTGATASRNYPSGLTEAYYRKLPILAITSTQPENRIGHHIAQVIDRSEIANDVARISLTLPIIKDAEDEWECTIKSNQAILEMFRSGGGPAHINLQTNSLSTYTTKVLPKTRLIKRYQQEDSLPDFPEGKVAVLVGSHRTWKNREVTALENFCTKTGAVVFCDHTSGYKGKNRLMFSLIGSQQYLDLSDLQPDLIIHIGEVTGDYPQFKISSGQVWRVNPDGEIRDTFRRLTNVFEMSEAAFFETYTPTSPRNSSYYELCSSTLEAIKKEIPELPFSNIYLASKMADKIPSNSTIHFGILNSLRSWNFFELPKTVSSMTNVGGFGIDGCLSSTVGASFSDNARIYFCILGDLAFFYDMNVLGNRHINKNLRILLVNNGKGTEFKQYKHHTSHFGDDADDFISAAGHFGNQSPNLVKNFAENLGFEYISASNKEEFAIVYERFLTPTLTNKPMLFEIFTESAEESKALEVIMNLQKDLSVIGRSVFRDKAKAAAKGVLGNKIINSIRKRV